MSVIGFLKHYGLDSHFKLNIEPNHTTLAGHSYEHDIVMASAWDISNLPDNCHLCTIATVTVTPYHLCCRTGLACWVQLTQTLAPQTWAGTPTSFPWTSGTPRWSWRRANCFDIIFLILFLLCNGEILQIIFFKANIAPLCYLVNVGNLGNSCLLKHTLRAEQRAAQYKDNR